MLCLDACGWLCFAGQPLRGTTTANDCTRRQRPALSAAVVSIATNCVATIKEAISSLPGGTSLHTQLASKCESLGALRVTIIGHDGHFFFHEHGRRVGMVPRSGGKNSLMVEKITRTTNTTQKNTTKGPKPSHHHHAVFPLCWVKQVRQKRVGLNSRTKSISAQVCAQAKLCLFVQQCHGMAAKEN